MNTKKVMAVALAGLLSVGFLAGCGTKDKKQNANKPNAGTKVEQKANPKKDTKFKTKDNKKTEKPAEKDNKKDDKKSNTLNKTEKKNLNKKNLNKGNKKDTPTTENQKDSKLKK